MKASFQAYHQIAAFRWKLWLNRQKGLKRPEELKKVKESGRRA